MKLVRSNAVSQKPREQQVVGRESSADHVQTEVAAMLFFAGQRCQVFTDRSRQSGGLDMDHDRVAVEFTDRVNCRVNAAGELHHQPNISFFTFQIWRPESAHPAH